MAQIANDHPALIYQAEGYDEPDKSSWSDADRAAFDEASEILRAKVEGFSRFQNFTRRKSDGVMCARLQYAWDEHFTGVGYFDLIEIDETEPARA